MDELRLILLLIGFAVVVGVYAWTRFQAHGGRRPSLGRKRPEEEPDDQAVQQELARMQQVMGDAAMHDVAPDAAPPPQPAATLDAAPADPDDERIVVLSVVAGQGQAFHGDALARAFANNDLRFGEKGIFHRMTHSAGQVVSVFGVANMVKPGDFGDGRLRGFATPGITLFLQLPGPLNNLEAYDDFVHTAERLAVELGGQLLDARHGVVTHQTLMQIRTTLDPAGLHPQAVS